MKKGNDVFQCEVVPTNSRVDLCFSYSGFIFVLTSAHGNDKLVWE